MDATFANYQGHPPDDTYPRKTLMDYFTLVVSLIVVAIRIGFVLLHFALCADIYIQARESARPRGELRAGETREGHDQIGEEQEQDLERNLGDEWDPIRRDWYYDGATESSHLLSAVYDGDTSDTD